MDQNELDFIDFIKLDTQGTEQEILKSAADKLKDKRIGLIYSEVTFIEAYKNQNLFSDPEIYLRKHGYEFIDCKYYPASFDTFKLRLGSKIFENPGNRWAETLFLFQILILRISIMTLASG